VHNWISLQLIRNVAFVMDFLIFSAIIWLSKYQTMVFLTLMSNELRRVKIIWYVHNPLPHMEPFTKFLFLSNKFNWDEKLSFNLLFGYIKVWNNTTHKLIRHVSEEGCNILNTMQHNNRSIMYCGTHCCQVTDKMWANNFLFHVMEVFLFSMDSLPWENQPLGFIKKKCFSYI